MPVYTLAQQRALVLRRLRATDTVRFSPTSGSADYDWIDDAIVRAEEEFVRQTKSLKTWAIIQLKSGVRTYRLPTDMVDIAAAYFYKSTLDGGYKEIDFTTQEKLSEEVSDWRTDTGDPERLYIDRKRGDMDTLGVYPVPETDGADITFTNSNASEVTWICPLYESRWDFGRILRYAADDSFIISASDTALVDPEVSDGNILIEYFRLPYQRGEVPPESTKCISAYAAGDLLSDNPEDSAEYKRSQVLMASFDKEIAIYTNRRKRPVTAQNLRVVPAVWSWQKNMTYYKEMP